MGTLQSYLDGRQVAATFPRGGRAHWVRSDASPAFGRLAWCGMSPGAEVAWRVVDYSNEARESVTCALCWRAMSEGETQPHRQATTPMAARARGRVPVELTAAQIEALCTAVVEWETHHQAEEDDRVEQPDRRLAPTMDRAYRALRAAVGPPPLPRMPPPELNRTAG